MQAHETLIIDPRFNGPPDSGQGGYVSGRVAALLDHDVVEVTLRSPPPLDRAMRVTRSGGNVTIDDDGTTVAEARASILDLTIPDPVPFEEASDVARSYPGFEHHVYPTCFVCGTERAPGDGLRIFVGKLDGRRVGAGPWTPDDELAEGGSVATQYMWAALDCPSFWGAVVVDDLTEQVLLGRMTARVERAAQAGERCVVLGWPLGRDGRKIYAGSAVFGGSGELLGAARTTWITLR